MGSLSLVPYLAARVGLSTSPYMAVAALPPVELMRPDSAPRSIRRGGSGTGNTFGMIVDADPNTEVRGSAWYGSMGKAGVAQNMMRDPHCRQTIRYVADPLGAASWRFETKGARPEDREAARFAEYAFLDQPFWARYRERAIANYYTCGFDLHEMTDDVCALPPGRFPLHPGGGRGLVPTGLHEIPCNTVSYFHQSKTDPNQLDRVTQWIPYSDIEQCGWRDIPADRIVRLTWGQEGANFQGLAPYRSIYGPWKLKTAFQTYQAILHDRCAVPYPSSTQAENAEPEDIEAVDNILAEMRSHPKGYMNLPFGYTFSWLQASCDDAANLGEAIVRCNVDISHNASCGFMMLGLATKTGSNALAGTQEGQYHLATVTHAGFFASGINSSPDGWSPVERIVRANYGPDVAIPTLVARNLPTHPWQELAKVAVNAITSKAIRKDERTESHIREWLQLDPFDADTEIKDIVPPPAVIREQSNDPMKRNPAPAGNNDMEPGHDNEPTDTEAPANE